MTEKYVTMTAFPLFYFYFDDVISILSVYDKEQWCPAWSAQGKCTSIKNWAWMLNNCPESCDLSRMYSIFLLNIILAFFFLVPFTYIFIYISFCTVMFSGSEPYCNFYSVIKLVYTPLHVLNKRCMVSYSHACHGTWWARKNKSMMQFIQFEQNA